MPDQTAPAPPAEYRSPFKPVGHDGPCQEFKVGGQAGAGETPAIPPVEYGCIDVERTLGRGWRVTSAPQHARMSLAVLVSGGYGLNVQSDDHLLILDQVLYQVVGYDPLSCSLNLELVQDYRPGAAQFPAVDVGRHEEPAG